MSYWEFHAGDISLCSFILGQAFYCLCKPSFSWFAWVITWARAIACTSCQGLIFGLLSSFLSNRQVLVVLFGKSSQEYPAECAPVPFCMEEGWVVYYIFKREGYLTGSPFLVEGCWERGGWPFSGGCIFYIKSKLKSEIFNDEKSL